MSDETNIGDIPLHPHPYQRETSELAWYSVMNSGWAVKCAKQGYALLYEHGPLTLLELEHRAAEQDGRVPKGRSESTVIRRLYDLRDAGVVRPGLTRVCEISGKKALTWDVTTEMCPPEKVKKKSTCPDCVELRLENEELRAQLRHLQQPVVTDFPGLQ